MHSVLISLDHITIYSFGACLALGIILCYITMARLGRRNGYSADFVSTLLTILILTGLFGARLGYVIEHWRQYAEAPMSIFRVQEGGLMFYGGLIVSAIFLVAFCRFQKKSIGDVLDLIVTAIPIGQAVGRVGCFLNGCCYGKASDSPIAVCFPKGSIPWGEQLNAGLITEQATCSLSVMPSQLFETALTLVIFAILVPLYSRRRHKGIQVARYMVLYAMARFLVEFTRADARLHFGPLSIGQTISIGLFVSGIAMMLYLRTKPADFPPPDTTEKA